VAEAAQAYDRAANAAAPPYDLGVEPDGAEEKDAGYLDSGVLEPEDLYASETLFTEGDAPSPAGSARRGRRVSEV
jgi:hypothetical protein